MQSTTASWLSQANLATLLRPIGRLTLSGKWDLGIDSLRSDWRALFNKAHLRDDLVAGLVVACAAVPLSLAISLASGVSPATGLITAIVAGFICALFGGTPLAVSGPAAAMAVLISSVGARHGMGGLIAVTVVSGLLQVMTGILRLGRLVKYIPSPVVMGFTAGIGAIILAGQLPRAFGLPAPDPSHICGFWTHAGEIVRQINPSALLMALATLLIMLFVPKRWPKVPAALVAVVVPSVLAFSFGLQIETIGKIPSSLPMPQFPSIPTSGIGELLVASLTVFALASLETLLSSSAVDKLSKAKPHDPDQELIGQGLGNVASSLFGGIPATGVIARSGLNIQAGGKTRRSALFHSVFLLATVYLLSPIVGKIPIAVLAGILLSVALKMLSPKELTGLWRSSKSDAVVYAVTFIVIVTVGLLAGIQAGVAASLVIAALRLSQIQITSHDHKEEATFRVSLVGPLTFLASSKLEKLKDKLIEKAEKHVLFDLSRLTLVDSSGAEQLADVAELLSRQGANVVLLSPSGTCRRLLERSGQAEICRLFVTSESEARTRFGDNGSLCRLVHGLNLYGQSRSKYDTLFEKLSSGQSPHTLLITCSDSRIDPGLITSTYPGELFVVRNVGNLVPRFGNTSAPSEQAALEYSLSVLNVRDLIVCGHSGCGAVQAMINGIPAGLPGVTKWLSMTMGRNILETSNVDDVARANIRTQIENLMSYPVVREKVERGDLQIHAWFYEIKTGEVLSWDENDLSFRNATERSHCPL